MKCPNCGAEIGSKRVCDFCGSRISYDMQLEQEKLNKKGCPKCGSTNVRFTREARGEIRDGNSRQVIYETVGICNDCGYTWRPEVDPATRPPKKRTWLWVLGWIFIFPVPLTIILLRKKDLNPVIRYGGIALAWIIYLLIAFNGSGKRDSRDTSVPAGDPPAVEEHEEADSQSTESVDAAATDPEPESEPDPEPETETTDSTDIPEPSDDSSQDADGDGISDDLKEFLDSFEAFVDYYCDFMANYDSSDPAQAEQYTEFFNRYNDFTKKASAWDSYDMNEKEYDYYMAVMSRISGKLLAMALSLD